MTFLKLSLLVCLANHNSDVHIAHPIVYLRLYFAFVLIVDSLLFVQFIVVPSGEFFN
jgi:hypothetical protein